MLKCKSEEMLEIWQIIPLLKGNFIVITNIALPLLKIQPHRNKIKISELFSGAYESLQTPSETYYFG